MPLLDINPKENKLINQSDACTHMFIAAVLKIPNTQSTKCLPTDEWEKKMWYIYTMKCYLAIKKSKFMSFAATWMELEVIILSEISQAQKEKYFMFSLMSLKKK